MLITEVPLEIGGFRVQPINLINPNLRLVSPSDVNKWTRVSVIQFQLVLLLVVTLLLFKVGTRRWALFSMYDKLSKLI